MTNKSENSSMYKKGIKRLPITSPVTRRGIMIKKQLEEKLAVFDFTFDPKEEPNLPKKKKRKRAPAKKKENPFIQSSLPPSKYSKNIGKKLDELKQMVAKKTTDQPGQVCSRSQSKDANININNNINMIPTDVIKTIPLTGQPVEKVQIKETNKVITIPNPIENVPIIDVSSTPEHEHRQRITEKTPKQIHFNKTNPDEIASFFEEMPVANSSFKSLKSPAPNASPWRVEFDMPAKKWPISMHIKPNMTPAYEMNFQDVDLTGGNVTRRPVYTNILSDSVNETNEQVESTGKLKQTSIIQFIRERVDKSSTKKKQLYDNITPVKENSLFGDTSPTVMSNEKTSKTINTRSTVNSGVRNLNFDTATEKENLAIVSPKKSSKRKKTDIFFGFNDTSYFDQENISPNKVSTSNTEQTNNRMRTRNALKDLNEIKEQFRHNKEVTARKSITPVELVEKENLSETPDAAVITSECLEPHLFEDFKIIHHQKPERKSYGKSSRPRLAVQNEHDSNTFKHNSDNSDTDNSDIIDELPNIDDSFTQLEVREARKPRTKKRRKEAMTKKEKEEADKWAKQFNHMLEEVDEFPLIVE